MKYLRLFEELEPDSVWKVSTKNPNFVIALNKIGVPQDTIDWYKEKCDPKYVKNDVVIIYKKDFSGHGSYWTWAEIRPEENMLNYYKNAYKYKGQISATSEEIEFWNTTNKYNL